MKQAFELFKLDWQRIFKNKLTFLLIIALMIIPSLYAWFNIAALWDPYSNTKDIAIAVYSDDKTANVLEKDINIGDKIITNLKDNDTVGWVFVDSKAELDKGVRSGKFYGGIYLPEDFSENLVSFVSGDIKKPEIKYSVNQKINAIAPKITDKGAGAIKDTISTEFVNTVSETLLTTFNELGYDLDANLPSINKLKSKILTVDDNLDKIDGYTKEVTELNKKMPDYKKKLDKANEFIKYIPEVNKMGDKLIEVNGMMPQIKESGKIILTVQEKIPDIQNAGKQIKMIDEDFDELAKMMNDAIEEAKKGLGIIAEAQKIIPEVEKLAETVSQLIPTLQTDVKEIQDALPYISKGIDSGLEIISIVANDVANKSQEVADLIGDKEVTAEDKAKIKAALANINSSLTSMNQMIGSTIETLVKLQELTGGEQLAGVISRLQESQNGISHLITLNQEVIDRIDELSAQELKAKLVAISQSANQIANTINGIDINALSKHVDSLLTDAGEMLGAASKISNTVVDKKLIAQIDSLLTSTSGTISQAIAFLEKYQGELPAIKTEIHSANTILNDNMPTIINGINQGAELYQNDLPVLEEKMNKAAAFVTSDLPKLETDIQKTLSMVNEKLPAVETALSSASTLIEEDWPSIRKNIHKAADLIHKGEKDIDLNELVKLLKSDAASESDFISNPVLIDQKDVYPVPNNGSASAPFYTALCLWVGAVLFSSIATTEFHLSEDEHKKYSKRSQFLGRMGTFLVVGFFQALIVSVGNLVLLGTYAVNPGLSILFSLLVGFTFMMMVYVLVALFGNLGKGAAVIILVLSISAGGGNYPIEMSGKFFQIIHPFIPFTHAVNLLREPVGGIYWPNALKAIVILIFIAILFFSLGLYLFPKIRGFFKKLNTNLQEGHILH